MKLWHSRASDSSTTPVRWRQTSADAVWTLTLLNTNLTGVVQCNGVGPSHHYFRSVFIHGTLAVSHIGDVLNHHLKLHAEAVIKSDHFVFLNIRVESVSVSLTQWSGFSPGWYNMGFDWTMSSTTLLLEISLERNCCGADRFFPSLLPRWL